MPTPPQRRNAAYLNRRISRTGQLDRDLDGQALMPEPDLRFDLGGSVERRVRPGDLGAAYLDGLLHSMRRLIEGATTLPSGFEDLCVLTVELSGAHASSCEWHFIPHASARTIC
jgi:hypothetical protein